MKTARIVVLGIALAAGGVAAYLASGSDPKTVVAEAPPALPTVDVLVAKADIGLGQAVGPDDMQWQTWPAATTRSSAPAPTAEYGRPAAALPEWPDPWHPDPRR